MDGQDYEEAETRGRGQPSALPTGDSYAAQPERDLQPGDPNLVGGATPAEKPKGMAEKVKGLLGGMKKGHHDSDTDPVVGSGATHTPESSPYGTAADTGNQSLDPSGGELRNENESDEGMAHPTNPQGVTNDQGGAALTDEQGNLKPGPHQDAVKRETIFSKIKDKVHGSK